MMAPVSQPTLYFIGVTTGQSSILRVFPAWAALLALDATLIGYDIALHAPRDAYRKIVRHIKEDPQVRGALVTTHKIDLLDAARDLFDVLDADARLIGEVSTIARHDKRLSGHAKDTVSSGLTWEAIVPAGHWGRSGGHVLCLGAGGAGIAISVYAAQRARPADQPRKFTLVDHDPHRLERTRAIHQQIRTTIEFDYRVNTRAQENDRLMAALPPGSLVINATGMGKDRPGSPITDHAPFPEDGLVWELNYRGTLGFLRQARRQATQRRLSIHDGWLYFLHGWSQAIAEIFEIQLTEALFSRLAEAAEAAPFARE